MARPVPSLPTKSSPTSWPLLPLPPLKMLGIVLMADPNASRKTDVRVIDDRYIGFQTDHLPMRVKAWRRVYREA
jgi:hypothetical protein